ncbi:hypothetical protein EG829_15865 [bacterium]|nr:hypothetical protein [bacterium]
MCGGEVDSLQLRGDEIRLAHPTAIDVPHRVLDVIRVCVYESHNSRRRVYMDVVGIEVAHHLPSLVEVVDSRCEVPRHDDEVAPGSGTSIAIGVYLSQSTAIDPRHHVAYESAPDVQDISWPCTLHGSGGGARRDHRGQLLMPLICTVRRVEDLGNPVLLSLKSE